MDPVVKAAYDLVVLNIDVRVELYKGHERQWCPFERQTTYDLCLRCSHSLAGQIMDACLTAEPWQSYSDLRWIRLTLHARCVVPTCIEVDLSFVRKRKRSAQVLLLLQAAGLPYDLAWPIAAVACWLL